MINNKNKKGFTLVEILIGILITTTVIIAGFNAYMSLGIGKIKLIESTNIEKEAFFFTQKLFEEIKRGGLVDYEEYFNRGVYDNTTYASGHYEKETGVGNFGEGGVIGSNYGTGFYFCRSGDKNSGGTQMGTGGCVSNTNTGSLGTDQSYSGSFQRYGQYSYQFIDYNSNADDDLGDEDGDGSIFGDDDDEYLGAGPAVFESGTGVTELYLISADKSKRTYFRWYVKEDPKKPGSATCDFTNPQNPTGTGCLGTIQFLKFDGRDIGLSHTKANESTLYDGVVDTWYINKDFAGGTEVIAGKNGSYEDNWMSLFPDTINVKDFKVYVYPNKDNKLAWKEETNSAPYVRLKMTLSPSRKVKKAIKGTIPEFNISTTINLTDIYSR